MESSERGPDRLGFSEKDFKVCDFCGALNPVTNTDCFVCSWDGRFHTDRESVRDAMEALTNEYGEITRSLFTEEVLPSTPPKPGIWADVWRSLKRVFCRA